MDALLSSHEPGEIRLGEPDSAGRPCHCSSPLANSIFFVLLETYGDLDLSLSRNEKLFANIHLTSYTAVFSTPPFKWISALDISVQDRPASQR
jgi:hypothetical protein